MYGHLRQKWNLTYISLDFVEYTKLTKNCTHFSKVCSLVPGGSLNAFDVLQFGSIKYPTCTQSTRTQLSSCWLGLGTHQTKSDERDIKYTWCRWTLSPISKKSTSAECQSRLIWSSNTSFTYLWMVTELLSKIFITEQLLLMIHFKTIKSFSGNWHFINKGRQVACSSDENASRITVQTISVNNTRFH